MRNKLINLCRRLLGFLEAKNNNTEYMDRVDCILQLFHITLPNIDEAWTNITIIGNDPELNYFMLPSGKLPKYTVIVPEIPLYVIVFDIRSANWEQARDRGISRVEWETYQADMDSLITNTLNLSTKGFTTPPQVLPIKWNDTVNHITLAQKLEGCKPCSNII